MAGDLGDPQPIRAIVTAPDQDSRDDDTGQLQPSLGHGQPGQ
jgi:hypothetical protein